MATSASATADVIDLKVFLDRLTHGGSLTYQEATTVAEAIARNAFDPIQLAAFLALLAARGEERDVVCAFATVLRRHALCVDVREDLRARLVDLVGTGGDGHNSVNISTAACIVAAACGVPIAKHGSVSVSSRSGAADVLSELGIAALHPHEVADCLQQTGAAFLFAPLFHPALKHAVPVRKAMKMRTIFNILGPLLNPCGTRRAVLGVYSPRLLPIFAETARELGAEHVLVVHCCGMDEITPVGPTQALEVRGSSITALTIDPTSFGVAPCTIADLEGGSPAENAVIIRKTLRAHRLAAQLDSPGGAAASPVVDPHVSAPIESTIALNAGAALYVGGLAESIPQGYELALSKMRSGDIDEFLHSWASHTQKLVAARRSVDSAAASTVSTPA